MKKIVSSVAIVAIIASNQAFGILGKKKATTTVYPSTSKSTKVKIVPTKKTVQREIVVRNTLKNKTIFVCVDCNYKTAKFGGGYDRRSTAKKITTKRRSSTFFSHFPKEEKIAIRWTTNPNEKNTIWYETEYSNYADHKPGKPVVIDIYDDGKYKYAVTKAGMQTANKLIFVKAGSKPPRPTIAKPNNP